MLVDAVRPHATGARRTAALTLRGDLLNAIGDPMAASAYREALDGAEPGGDEAPAGPPRPDARSCPATSRRRPPPWTVLEHRRRCRRRRHPPHPGQVRVLHLRLRDGAGGGRRGAATRPRRRARLEGARSGRAPGHAGPPVRQLVRPDAPRAASAPGRTPRSPTPSSTATSARRSTCSTGRRPTREVIGVARDLQATARRSGALRAGGVRLGAHRRGRAALGRPGTRRGRAARRRATCTTTSARAAGEAHSLQRLAEVRLAEGDRRRGDAAAAAGPSAGPRLDDRHATSCNASSAR